MSAWMEVVRVHWILGCNSLNWTYLYDADGFLQFRVLIRVLEPISITNETRDSFYFNKIQHFVNMEGDCQCPLELVVSFTYLDISL